jgi:hypothetical protein
VRTVSNDNFGLLIAYVLPGLTCLWGVSFHCEPIRLWLGNAPESQPTVAGFLYLTLGAVAAGMAASTLRWAIIDSLHHLSGIECPNWDYRRLQANLAAYSLIVEHQYRYYQLYGGMVIALIVVLASRLALGISALNHFDFMLVPVIGGYFVASRDTLTKYYRRCHQFLTQA